MKSQQNRIELVTRPAAVVVVVAELARPDGPRPVGELNDTERLGEDLPAGPETDVKEKGEEALTEREPKDEEPKNESSG